MARILQNVKYSIKELKEYATKKDSCIQCINSDLHICVNPYVLADFKNALQSYLWRTKVGTYDAQLKGIVLDIKNVQVLGKSAALRADDPMLHINIKADFYVFCPKVGVVLSGVVKHIMRKRVVVIIYRVFNVTILCSTKINKEGIQMNQEIKFRIKNFDLQNIFPYIEGEILLSDTEETINRKKNNSIQFDSNNTETDSGIEEREDSKPVKDELDVLIKLIKEELPESMTIKSKKGKKHKKLLDKSDQFDDAKTENEDRTTERKKAKKSKRKQIEQRQNLDEHVSTTEECSFKKAKKRKLEIKEEPVSE